MEPWRRGGFTFVYVTGGGSKDAIKNLVSVSGTLNRVEVGMEAAKASAREGREQRFFRATLSHEQVVVRIIPRSH